MARRQGDRLCVAVYELAFLVLKVDPGSNPKVRVVRHTMGDDTYERRLREAERHCCGDIQSEVNTVHTLLTRNANTHCQYILSIHPVNTSCRHFLLTHPIKTSC